MSTVMIKRFLDALIIAFIVEIGVMCFLPLIAKIDITLIPWLASCCFGTAGLFFISSNLMDSPYGPKKEEVKARMMFVFIGVIAIILAFVVHDSKVPWLGF